MMSHLQIRVAFSARLIYDENGKGKCLFYAKQEFNDFYPAFQSLLFCEKKPASDIPL
jgi:hypothetical protein